MQLGELKGEWTYGELLLDAALPGINSFEIGLGFFEFYVVLFVDIQLARSHVIWIGDFGELFALLFAELTEAEMEVVKLAQIQLPLGVFANHVDGGEQVALPIRIRAGSDSSELADLFKAIAVAVVDAVKIDCAW